MFFDVFIFEIVGWMQVRPISAPGSKTTYLKRESNYMQISTYKYL